MDTQSRLICIIVQRHPDDQRVKQWFDLLSSKCAVYVISGAVGESLISMEASESLATVNGTSSLSPIDFDANVDFVLLHGGDSGGNNDCWSGAKSCLSGFEGPVFLYDSPGTPSIPDNDHRYLIIRRATKPLFEITARHVEELVHFVRFGNPVPSCCNERSNLLIALKLLCQCHEMGTLNETELKARGIKDTGSLKLAASWFLDAKNWRDVLKEEFFLEAKRELGTEGVYSYLTAIADLSRDQSTGECTEAKLVQSDANRELSGTSLRALVSGLSSAINQELKKYV